MRMHGNVIHCDREPFTGQKKATRGKAGFSCFVPVSSCITVPFEELLASARFLLDRWLEALDAMSS